MYLDSPFARPVSSFRRPAPVLDIDPDVSPDKTVCFRSEWTPYIVGALRQLLLQTTWATDDPDVLNVMQARAQLLISLFMEGCEVETIPFDVRQNIEAPCTLEKTTDGETWTAWADLQKCPPKIRAGGSGGLDWFDGTAWVPLPGQGDERYDGDAPPPYPPGTVPSGQTGNCLAAENITAFFASSLTQVKQGLDVGTSVSTSMGIIAGTIGFLGFISGGVFAAVGLILAGLLSALGSAGINDMLTDETLDTLKCAIANNINADGSVTADQYNAITDELNAKLTSPKKDIVINWLEGFGPVGLTRQGKASGITTGDCSACEPPVTMCFFGGQGHTDNLTVDAHTTFDITADFVYGQYTINVAFNRITHVKVNSWSGWSARANGDLSWGFTLPSFNQLGCADASHQQYAYFPDVNWQTFDIFTTTLAIVSETPFSINVTVY